MKLKYNFVTNEVGSEIVALPVDASNDEFNGFIKMNATGLYIFNMLKEDTTKEKIVEGILADFEGATPELAEKTVGEFIENLRKSGVIVD